MTNNVVRFSDYERKSREADSVAPRDPCEATIIILPSAPADVPCTLPFQRLPHCGCDPGVGPRPPCTCAEHDAQAAQIPQTQSP